MDEDNLPLFPGFIWNDEQEEDPEKMSGIALERQGIEETFDKESATFLDDEQIVAPKRDEYSPGQRHCSANPGSGDHDGARP